jgi:uncharacterized membrane protein
MKSDNPLVLEVLKQLLLYMISGWQPFFTASVCVSFIKMLRRNVIRLPFFSLLRITEVEVVVKDMHLILGVVRSLRNITSACIVLDLLPRLR